MYTEIDSRVENSTRFLQPETMTFALVTALFFTMFSPAGANSTEDWSLVLRGPCARCVESSDERMNAPASIPKRAVVYSMTGERATRVHWAVIDLDTGQIKEVDKQVTLDGRQPFFISQRSANKAALRKLRAMAAILWRSAPSKGFRRPPGVGEDAWVVSGSQMARYSRFFPADSYIYNAVNTTLYENGR